MATKEELQAAGDIMMNTKQGPRTGADLPAAEFCPLLLKKESAVKSPHKVGRLEVGADFYLNTHQWFVFVKSKKETLRLPVDGGKEQAIAQAAVLAGMIREGSHEEES